MKRKEKKAIACRLTLTLRNEMVFSVHFLKWRPFLFWKLSKKKEKEKKRKKNNVHMIWCTCFRGAC